MTFTWPDPQKLSQPEGWTAVVLQLAAAGRDAEAAELWAEHGPRRPPPPLARDHAGSWNHRELLLAAGALAAPVLERGGWWEALERHARDQLDATSGIGLGGREALSTVYPWQLPVYALMHSRARPDSRTVMARAASAFACLYLTFAMPDPRGGPLVVLAPGQRSAPDPRGSMRSRLLAGALGYPIQPGTAHAEWPARLMAESRVSFMRPRSLDELVEHVATGSMTSRLLREVGALIRGGIAGGRRGDEAAWWMPAVLTQNTAPVLAVSRVRRGGRPVDSYAVVPGTEKYRAGRGKTLGRASVSAAPGRLTVRHEGVVLSPGAEPRDLEAVILAPDFGSC